MIVCDTSGLFAIFNRRARYTQLGGREFSAVRDVESIHGLRVTGAGREDLVSMLEIAQRARRLGPLLGIAGQ